MFKVWRNWWAEQKLRWRISRYERKHSRPRPISERPEPVPVESTFDSFVTAFGGRKISDLIASKAQMPLNADYFFESYNVIAELKTVEGIFAGPEAHKQFVNAFTDSGATGSDLMGVLFRGEEIPRDVQAIIKKRIRRALEQRVKQARKQLRKSKEIVGNKDTSLLIIIAMNQQPLFGHKMMLGSLATLMGDNYSDEHTDAVIYLNPNVPTKISPDGMEFGGWYPFYRDDEVNESLAEFVNLLGNRWLRYYGSVIGETNPIIELDSPDELFRILR